MRRWRRHQLLLLAVLAVTAGCATVRYNRTDTGRFGGKLEVRWIKPNSFLFVPVKDDPFYFTRKDGRRIQPGPMYTDGGSIPQPIWGVPGYSPWGYAPAYIVHDWIFEAHECRYDPDASFTFDESATLIAEGIKTLMETQQAPRDPVTLYLIYQAVKTPIAKKLWDSGTCNAPGPEGFEAATPSLLITTIDMTPR